MFEHSCFGMNALKNVCAFECLCIRMFVHSCLSIKGGPEPLEKEINEILGSKREDRLSDPFFLNWYKIPVWFVFRTCFAFAISVRPRGTCESSRRSARR